MLLYLFLLMPILLVMYCMYAQDKRNAVVIFAGLFTGVIVCIIKVVFTFAHRVVPFGLAPNFVHYVVEQTVVPVLIVYLVYALVFRDKLDFKVQMAFPLLISFYAVYMPYCVIGVTESIYSAYDLFIKPSVYAAMLGLFAQTLHFLNYSFTNKKYLFMPLGVVCMIGALLFPAVSQAMYDINTQFVLNLVLSIIFVLLSLGWPVLKLIKYLKSSETVAEAAV